MKKLILTTALVTAMGMPAIAQDTGEMFRAEADPNEIHASNLIGMRVYSSESADAEGYEGVQDDWNDIGEINDVILSREGEVQAVLVDIGGFLGIGENQVAVDMNALRFVSDDATAEDDSDYFLVLNASRESLEQAPAYQWGAEDSAASGSMETDSSATSDTDMATDSDTAADTADTSASDSGDTDMTATDSAEAPDAETAEAPATGSGETDMTADTAENAEAPAAEGGETDMTAAEPADGTGAPMFEREGYMMAEEVDLTAERLTGAAAYDANDERIGEVSEILLNDGGEVESVVVDVGGFLGIGEKPVELTLSEIDILRAEDGSDIRVYISMTESELESMPDYEG